MAVRVFIDGTELEVPTIGGTYALTGSVTRRLNRPSQATVTVPMTFSFGGAGSRLKIEIDDYPHTPAFHGFVMDCETDTAEDGGTTVYNAMDPLELWQWRPVRDYDGLTPGNFVDPYILEDKKFGGEIIRNMILASENPALIPEAAEGPTFLSLGTFEPGGSNLSGAPVTWPMPMSEMLSVLTSTGELDVVLTPIDAGGNMAQIDTYTGDYGDHLEGSVVFEYGQGLRNIRQVRWNEDMSFVRNKIQYFFSPKETVRRYKGNITGDDPGLRITSPDEFRTLPPGGDLQLVHVDNTLGARRIASQAAYGVRMHIQEFEVDTLYREEYDPSDPDPPYAPPDVALTAIEVDGVRILYRRLWQIESWLAAFPRTLIHFVPIRGYGVGLFDIGDIVGVTIAPVVRGGLSGAQRVYGYTTSWDNDGVVAITEIQTSADQEGFK